MAHSMPSGPLCDSPRLERGCLVYIYMDLFGANCLITRKEAGSLQRG
jgi:hypothetical protein